MFYIDDYKKRAVNKIIPYLVDYPQIVKIIENSADRYQAVEDLLWDVATNFKVVDSRGVFLDAHAKNEVIDIIYTDKANDAFTYGTDMPMYQAYGKGKYYSQASYISGIRKNISEDKLIRAVQAKIIQNNTNCTIEDLIESLKLLYNATNVKLYESNPLNLSIMLSGDNLELSSSGNYENVKNMIPACVNLTNIFVNPNQFDLFLYDENCSYGENRYPVRVGDTIDLYNYISQSVNLDSEFEEHIITNHVKFDNNMICCISGEFTKLNDGAVLFSSNDIDGKNSIKVGVKYKEDGEAYIFANYTNKLEGSEELVSTEIIDDKIIKLNKRYTLIIMNDNKKFKTWLFDGIFIKGEENEADISKVLNRVSNIQPNITINNYVTIEAPIYINCEQSETTPINFGDFLYYAIIFANVDITNNAINTTEYYATCYGEKQILFNCIENKNHLYINTQNPLLSNIMVQQSYYNYKATHSNGKYLYLDGKSSIDYYVLPENISCFISDMTIEFEICMPKEVKDGMILSGLINGVDESGFFIEGEGNNKTITFKCKHYDENSEPQEIMVSSDTYLENDKFYKIKLIYNGNTFYLYINDVLVTENDLDFKLFDINKTIIVGSNSDLSCAYNGFIKNLYININGTNEDNKYNVTLNLPYKHTLQDKDKKYEYLNFGARFITTPQLIDDKKGLDLYGNSLIGTRVKGDLL